ncbi:MAG: SDR family NAD(P)-dependent oxidoreductase [Spirochaetia bacterium]
MNGKLFDLNGKTALITGSSRGLGLVFARGLAQAGATVVLNERNGETLQQAVAGLKDLMLRGTRSTW